MWKSASTRIGRGTAKPPTLFARLLTNEAGAAIIEMAIVATPFFLLLMAVVEQGILLYKREILLTAVNDASRLIRTGRANSAGYTQEQFRQQVCNRLPSFFGCSTVSVDVRPYSSFTTARPYRALTANGTYDPSLMQYDIGGAGTIVMVSATSMSSRPRCRVIPRSAAIPSAPG